jgi:hypothetical protein
MPGGLLLVRARLKHQSSLASVSVVVKMASSSESSRSQRQRLPQVGLSNPRGVLNPRSARAQANDEEVVRRVIQSIVREDEVGLDIPGYDDSGSESENNSLDTSEASENVDEESEVEIQVDGENEEHDYAAAPPPASEAIVVRNRPRNRHFWAGNDSKLNMMAGKYLNQPLRQEIIANGSNNAEVVSQIRSLKRLPNRDLDYDNLKHSGKIFLVQKTTEELNACELFKEMMPANQRLSVELCRQKIKEFQSIAVNTADADIDRRVLIILFNFYCATFTDTCVCGRS